MWGLDVYLERYIYVHMYIYVYVYIYMYMLWCHVLDVFLGEIIGAKHKNNEKSYLIMTQDAVPQPNSKASPKNRCSRSGDMR